MIIFLFGSVWLNDVMSPSEPGKSETRVRDSSLGKFQWNWDSYQAWNLIDMLKRFPSWLACFKLLLATFARHTFFLTAWLLSSSRWFERKWTLKMLDIKFFLHLYNKNVPWKQILPLPWTYFVSAGHGRGLNLLGNWILHYIEKKSLILW